MDRKVLPLGIYTLKSFLSDSYPETIVIDAVTKQYTEDEIVDLLITNQCNVVGISGVTNSYYNSILSLSKRLKELPFIRCVFAGGPIATFCYDVMLLETSFDFVIRGEGEIVLKNVLDKLSKDEEIRQIRGIAYLDQTNGQIIANSLEERMTEFDKFIPEKYSFEKDIIAEFISGNRSYVIMASRGCVGNCTFCQVPRYYGQKGIRWRSPVDVVDEIEYAVDHWGVRRVNFQDSNFLCNSKWVDQFIDEISNREVHFKFNVFADAESVDYERIKRLEKIGLYQVFVGFETGSEERFYKLGKKAKFEDNQKAVTILKRTGMKVIPGFILFFPDSTIPEILDSVEWFQKNKFLKPSMYFNKMDLWYGTELYRLVEANNCIVSNSMNDGVSYRFLDQKVNILYEYMMIGLNEFKSVWGKLTAENAKRRSHLADQVYQRINVADAGMEPDYKPIIQKVQAYYNERDNYSFGRSRNNEVLLNQIVREYFEEAIRHLDTSTMNVSEKKMYMKEFARCLIEEHHSFEWLSDLDFKAQEAVIHEILEG